jgi:hypothetical protein
MIFFVLRSEHLSFDLKFDSRPGYAKFENQLKKVYFKKKI